MKTSKKLGLASVFLLTSITLAGCIKPYDKPSFVEIEPNQTAFVIPLEGDTTEQGQFQSQAFLESAQVATKRIQIPHRWVQLKRWEWQGEWKDTVRVIVVDRYPATRQWADNEAFVGESKDSIKFNQGLSATAQILEEDAAAFLYQYAGRELEEVMNKEIRSKIGSVLLEQYSKKTIEEIRGDKSAVIKAVREEVEPYFKERGITLSNIGYIGDLKYLDPAIQQAINKKFNAEEEQKAQSIINDTEVAKAKAEAQANSIRKESMKEIMEIKQLELDEAWIKKWDGKLPQYITGDNASIMNIPGAK